MAANRAQIVQRNEYSIGVLPDGVDRSSEAFSGNSTAMGALLSDLQSHINKVSLFLFFFLFIAVCICFDFGLNGYFCVFVERFSPEEDQKL